MIVCRLSLSCSLFVALISKIEVPFYQMVIAEMCLCCVFSNLNVVFLVGFKLNDSNALSGSVAACTPLPSLVHPDLRLSASDRGCVCTATQATEGSNVNLECKSERHISSTS